MGLFYKKFAKSAFVKKASRALRDEGVTDAHYDDDQFAIVFGDNKDIWYLNNAYKEYNNAKIGERKAVLEKFAYSLTANQDILQDYQEAKEFLLPGIRDPQIKERLRYTDKPVTIVSQPFTPHLIQVLIFDQDLGMSLVGDGHLKDWNITFESAMTQAIDNLRKISSEAFQQIAPGVYVSPWNDDYDASRILLPELFYRIELQGNPVICIPTRNSVLVTGSKDNRGLEILAEKTQSILSEVSQPLTGYPFVLREDTWIPFIPTPSMTLNTSIYQWTEFVYNEQKTMMDDYFKRTNQDQFVATVITVTNQGSPESSSLCVWTKGVETYLPVTDLVAFYLPEEDITVMVEWKTVEELLGKDLHTTNYTPTRYFVNTFPNTRVLEKLKEFTVNAPQEASE